MTPSLLKFVREGTEPVSDKLGWQWIAENVGLPPGSEQKRFDFELFPLARFVLMQLCHNEYLRHFTEMLSAQVGKTVTILAYLCWKIKNRPSSVGWYTDTAINARNDYKTKVLPMLENCKPVAKLLPITRGKRSATLIQLGFMDLMVLGAESKRNREGKTISEVMCDEARNYPPGAMVQIDNRYKTISNLRRIIFSSAGDTTEEPWISFEAGTRHMGFWRCPHCQHKQTFRFGRKKSPIYDAPRTCGGYVWDDNELTHPSDDVYNFRELDKTVRYECENEKCRYRFQEGEKIALIKAVEFEQTNLMAEPQNVSVHCWEGYMPFAGCSWPSIVHKFLNASVAMRQGKIDQMKVFVKETLGEPWVDEGEKPVEGEILKRCGDYSIGEEWPTEVKCARQITCDLQMGFVVYNYSIFNQGGEKRTVDVGRLATFDEVREYQKAKKVKDRGVGIDCAHRPQHVFEECLKYGNWIPDPNGGKEHVWNGWVPLLGDDAEEFVHYVLDRDKNKVAIRTHFKPVLVNANEGRSGKQRPIHRYFWSGPHYKFELYFRRIKGEGLPWWIPKNIGNEYLKQMQVTERIEVRDAEGKTTGYLWKENGRHDDSDCELMQLALADINGITK